MLWTGVLRRGSPAELMAGLARWRTRAAAEAPRAHHMSETPVAPETDVAKRAFRHWKNTATGRWNPPKYSLRRQSQLLRAAIHTGDWESVQASPAFPKFADRLARQETHEILASWPTARPQPLTPQEDAKEARRIAHKAHTVGPYAGRASQRMFKGSQADRAGRARKRRVQENMHRMDTLVQDWRHEKALAKNKTKTSSPL